MNPFNRVLWMLACVSAAMLSFSCTKAEEETEGTNQIENKKQSVWAEEDLQPKEGEVTEDGQPVVMVFGATVNYAQKKQHTDENVSESGDEDEVDLGALEEQQTLAESGYDGEGVKSHLGDLVEDADPKYYPNLWSKGDRVSINGVSSASLPEANITSGGKQARFPMVQWVEKYDGNWYVGYPASAFDYSDGEATVTLPVKQTYVAGTYDSSAFIMVGKSDEQGLDFYPQVAPLRITVPGTAGTYYSKIRIEAVAGESLSGTFSTDYNNDEATFTAVSGNNYVEMDTPDLEFGSTPVFFVLPAQTYSRGLRIRVTRSSDSKEMVFSNTKSMTVTVGSMTALTSPSFTPTTAQTTPSLVEVTPSSFYVQWASGVPANDYAKRWQILVWEDNAECTGDPDRTIEIYPKAGCWPTSTTPLRFVVGRMTPGATYYVKVKDVGNDNSNTTPAEITLSSAPSTVKMPEFNITTTGEILREDFSEIGWSASYYDGVIAGGFYPTKSVGGSTFAGTKTFDVLETTDSTTFKTNSELHGFHLDRFNTAYDNSRLAQWFYYGYDYFMPGYIKMGTESSKGYLFTPAIPLASDKSAVVSVNVKAAKYDASSTGEVAVAVVNGVTCGYPDDGTDGHFKRRAKTGYSWPNSVSYLYGTMNFTTTAWSTQTVSGLCMSNGDRLIIGVPEDASASGGAARFNLASVTLTVTELDDVFVINNAATLESFRGLVAGGNTTLNARVDADVDARSLSWTSIDGYAGVLDGRGHTISGLTEPFFATLSGTVRGLTLNSTINYTTDVAKLAIFAQTLNGGTITNCISKGSVSYCSSTAVTEGKTRYVAGMVGSVTGNSTMTNCTNYASISLPHNSQTNSMNLEVGGLIGRLDNTSGGTISALRNVYDSGEGANSGKVSSSLIISTNTVRNYRVGGVIGYVTSEATAISNCTNSGVVEYAGSSSCFCNMRVGGIVGHMRKGASGCQNSGNVSVANTASIQNGYLALGGIAGFWDVSSGSLTGSYNSGTVSNAGTVHKNDYSLHACVGGLIGRATGAILTSTKAAYNYNNGSVLDSSDSDNVDVGGICGYTNGASNFTFCRNLAGGAVTVGTGSGSTKSAPHNINISGILALVDGLSTEITLTSAINAGAINVYGTDIGDTLSVGGILAKTIGSFPAISGTSTDLTTNSGAITFTNNNLTGMLRVGGVWGYRASQNSGTVEYCTNSGPIVANAGGLTTSKSNTNHSCVGGVVGGGGDSDSTPATKNMTVRNCSNTGTIYLNFQGRLFMGGIIGSVKTAPRYCSNQANVSMGRGANETGFSAVGGIVGYHRSSSRTFSNLSHNGQVGNADAVVCYASALIGYTNGNCTFNSCSIQGTIRCHDYNPGLFFSYPASESYNTISCSSSTVKSGTKLVSSSGTTTINSLSDITTSNIVGGKGVESLPASGLSVN